VVASASPRAVKDGVGNTQHLRIGPTPHLAWPYGDAEIAQVCLRQYFKKSDCSGATKLCCSSGPHEMTG
jgi:hypothetical protein